MTKKYFFFFITVLCALVCWSFLSNIVSSFLSGLFLGIIPIIVGFFIAYLLDHTVTFFEKVYHFTKLSSKAKHILSVLSGILSILIALAGIFALLLPAIIENVLSFSQNLPEYTQKINSLCQDIDAFLSLPQNVSLSSIINSVDQNSIDQLVSDLVKSAIDLFSTLSVSVVLSVMVLLEKQNIKKALNSFTNKFFKKPEKIKSTFYCAKIVLDGYLYGKLLECLSVGVLCTILFLVCSLPYSVLFGVICTILYVIPYVGGYIGLVPPCLVALTISTPVFLIVLIVGVVILNIVGTFISPVIYKNSMNISALTIMASILVGGSIGGILGFLIAPPIAALCKILLCSFVKPKNEKSSEKV